MLSENEEGGTLQDIGRAGLDNQTSTIGKALKDIDTLLYKKKAKSFAYIR
jgi:hypothetical protein